MDIPLLEFSKELNIPRKGIVSGIVRGLSLKETQSFLKTHSFNHLEIHPDSLHLVPLCKDLGVSFSYHSKWTREVSWELDTISALSQIGCTAVIVHPDRVDLENLRGIEDLVCLENLDMTYTEYRKS